MSSLRTALLTGASATTVTVQAQPYHPYSQACLPPNDKFDFCDTSKTFEERTELLVANLTVDEKVGLMGSATPDRCAQTTAAVPRLGIPEFMQCMEVNSGASSSCPKEGRCPTAWPSNAGTVASFNRTLWRQMGEIISTEQRAFSNMQLTRLGRDYKNHRVTPSAYYDINLAREPLWGRNSEVPSEDTYLTAERTIQYVKGLITNREATGKQYAKLWAGHKTYAIYSDEEHRGKLIPNVTAFDWYDYYSRQFALSCKGTGVCNVMCSYAGMNSTELTGGEAQPSCLSPFMLNTIREKWGFPDALISSDCGAVGYYEPAAGLGPDANASTIQHGLAKALSAGTDQFIDASVYDGNFSIAVAHATINESALARPLYRTLLPRFQLGLFDPVENVPWNSYGIEKVGLIANYNPLYEATIQSLVLARNDNNVLPIQKTNQKIALIGPHAFVQRNLFPSYSPKQICYDPNPGYNYPLVVYCVPTIEQEFQSAIDKEWFLGAEPGVIGQTNMTSDNASQIPAAVKLAAQADVAVVCIGSGHDVEKESQDRKITDLTGVQEELALKVLASGVKKVVFVLIEGGMISIDKLLSPPAGVDIAVVKAFFPGQLGASAIVNSLIGNHNRWSKMPVTTFDTTFQHVAPKREYGVAPDSTTGYPGRTYRYYTGKPLFEFGHGLSYTTFSTKCTADTTNSTITCAVTNTGKVIGDEVVLLFHAVSDAIRTANPESTVGYPLPVKSLVGFDRLTDIAPGDTATTVFTVESSMFETTTKEGDRVVLNGDHELIIGVGENAITTTWPRTEGW